MGRKFAKAAGIAEESVGGKLFRIGGASDLNEVIGPRSETLLRQRGRWASDAFHGYPRDSREASRNVAGRMAKVDLTCDNPRRSGGRRELPGGGMHSPFSMRQSCLPFAKSETKCPRQRKTTATPTPYRAGPQFGPKKS